MEKLPGADCGTDHNLLIADIKIKLKRIQRSKQTPIYDVEKNRTLLRCRDKK